MSARAALILGLAFAVASCEFGEVEIPDGEPMVVVFGVMRPDVDRQWVLLEQTLTGTTASDDTASSVIPGDPPPVPVANASVTVTNLTFAEDPCGESVFTESPTNPNLTRSLGLYWGPAGCPTMRPGDSLRLSVSTADGQTLSGLTEVVGAERMILRSNSETVVLPGPVLEFNRDVDTLDAEVSAEFGRSVQVEIARSDSNRVPDPKFLMFMDTTAISLPGNLVNFLDALLDDDEDTTSSESPESIFTAGKYHTATVALMDDNFFDYMRTGNTPLSGRGFVNHIEGGLGVFGCLMAAAGDLKVIGEIDDPREGSYGISGTVRGVAVDISLDLYVATAGDDTTDMAAFVEGDWVFGALDSSGDGSFAGANMELRIYQVDPNEATSISAISLSGRSSSSGPFTLTAFDRQMTEIGTVTVTRD